jgi:hypothetical protein
MFQVLEERLLPLRKDDPSVVLAMLEFAYSYRIDFPDREKFSIENALFVVELYHVATKYGFATLQEESVSYFGDEIWEQMKGYSDEDTATADVFLQIVGKIYTLPQAHSAHTMRECLIDLTKLEGPLQIFWNVDAGRQLLIDASKQVPEFGRDLFLSIMDETSDLSKRNSGKRNNVVIDMSIHKECSSCARVEPRERIIRRIERRLGQCMFCGIVGEKDLKVRPKVDGITIIRKG